MRARSLGGRFEAAFSRPAAREPAARGRDKTAAPFLLALPALRALALSARRRRQRRRRRLRLRRRAAHLPKEIQARRARIDGARAPSKHAPAGSSTASVGGGGLVDGRLAGLSRADAAAAALGWVNTLADDRPGAREPPRAQMNGNGYFDRRHLGTCSAKRFRFLTSARLVPSTLGARLWWREFASQSARLAKEREGKQRKEGRQLRATTLALKSRAPNKQINCASAARSWPKVGFNF